MVCVPPLRSCARARAPISRPSSTPAAPAVGDAVRGTRPLDVLLVADDAAWQHRCEQALLPFGPSVRMRTAETGYLALLQIGQHVPDLLVTHLDLPGMDGMGMLRTLERCEQMAGMRVLVLSAASEHEIARRGGLPACAELMRLPVPPEAVAVRVGRHLLSQHTG